MEQCTYCLEQFKTVGLQHLKNCPIKKQVVEAGEENHFYCKINDRIFITAGGMVALMIRAELSDEDWIKQEEKRTKRRKDSSDLNAAKELLAFEQEEGIRFKVVEIGFRDWKVLVIDRKTGQEISSESQEKVK